MSVEAGDAMPESRAGSLRLQPAHGCRRRADGAALLSAPSAHPDARPGPTLAAATRPRTQKCRPEANHGRHPEDCSGPTKRLTQDPLRVDLPRLHRRFVVWYAAAPIKAEVSHSRSSIAGETGPAADDVSGTHCSSRHPEGASALSAAGGRIGGCFPAEATEGSGSQRSARVAARCASETPRPRPSARPHPEPRETSTSAQDPASRTDSAPPSVPRSALAESSGQTPG